MLKSKVLIALFFAVSALAACKKTESSDVQIQTFIKANNIAAVKHSSGLYYQIITPGTGNFTYPSNTQITIKYEGRLLDGNMFDNGGGTQQTFALAQLIKGWQIGVPLIQKGGKIRLLVPSELGYGSQSAGPIPANSPLDFTIELIDVK